MGIKILGTGSAIPKKKVDNSFFENYLDTNDEWIRKRTGIKTRFFFEKDEELADSVIKAASLAVLNLDIKKIKLDGYSLNKDLSDEKNLIFTRKNS